MKPIANRIPSAFSLSASCALLSFVCAACPGWWQPGQAFPQLPAAADPADSVLEPVIPARHSECPTLETGEVEIAGVPVRLWLGATPARGSVPLVIYWHGTGSSPVEAEGMLGDAFNELMTEGGLLVALGGTTGEGKITSTGTWSTGDFDIADQIVACAVEQLPIDTHRIYTTGCSSGAVHAGVMAYQRSSYIAAAALNSGGRVETFALEEPAHVPAVMTSHGPAGFDVVIIDFAEASIRYATDLAAAGGFAVDCGHSGGHCGAPAELKRAHWQFLKDHPFGVSPEPYADALPTSFPEYCSSFSK